MKMNKTERIESYKVELTDILKTMDIPEMRMDLNKHNILWLSRNMSIKNNEHKHFHRATHIIVWLIKNME